MGMGSVGAIPRRVKARNRITVFIDGLGLIIDFDSSQSAQTARGEREGVEFGFLDRPQVFPAFSH